MTRISSSETWTHKEFDNDLCLRCHLLVDLRVSRKNARVNMSKTWIIEKSVSWLHGSRIQRIDRHWRFSLGVIAELLSIRTSRFLSTRPLHARLGKV